MQGWANQVGRHLQQQCHLIIPALFPLFLTWLGLLSTQVPHFLSLFWLFFFIWFSCCWNLGLNHFDCVFVSARLSSFMKLTNSYMIVVFWLFSVVGNESRMDRYCKELGLFVNLAGMVKFQLYLPCWFFEKLILGKTVSQVWRVLISSRLPVAYHHQ